MNLRFAWLSLVCLTACTADAPTDSTITLGTETWTAGAMFSDSLGDSALEIYIAPTVDTHTCGSTLSDSVSVSLVVDDRSQPHVLLPLDVAQAPGSVEYDDGDHATRAIAGRVSPTLTAWGPRPATGRFDRIVQVDGTLDVTLADGRRLNADFTAHVCD